MVLVGRNGAGKTALLARLAYALGNAYEVAGSSQNAQQAWETALEGWEPLGDVHEAMVLGASILGVLTAEARLARRTIGNVFEDTTPDASGWYGEGRPGPAQKIALLGDSSAVGYGVERVAETPGAHLASGLAEGAAAPAGPAAADEAPTEAPATAAPGHPCGTPRKRRRMSSSPWVVGTGGAGLLGWARSWAP